MMRALWTGASGMKAQQTNVDTIANNLANVNTVGYKSQSTQFKSLLYQTLRTETTTANGENKPTTAQVGLGARVASTNTEYTQGTMQANASKTALCISGSGFFAVRGADNGTYYTRSGNFTWSLDANGNTILTTADGNPVLDREGNEIMVPEGVASEAMVFSDDGSISYKDPETSNVIPLNQYFGIYQFNNPAGLEKLSSSKLMATPASGAPLLEGQTPGLSLSKVHQCYLEGSNVNVADEMVNMIIAQRAYELNSKAIQTADSMLDTANNLKR